MYAELTGCVICASASSLKPFFTRYLPGLFGSHIGSSTGPSHTGATKGSYATRSRRQQSRKQPDAIELQSEDDSESARKINYDDEAKLWPQSDSQQSQTVMVSAKKPKRSFSKYASRSGSSSNSQATNNPSHLTPSHRGINIVSTTEVLYSLRE